MALGPQGVLTQAERYSKGIAQSPRYWEEFGVPFLYSTNGAQVWFHDCVASGRWCQTRQTERVNSSHLPHASAAAKHSLEVVTKKAYFRTDLEGHEDLLVLHGSVARAGAS